MERDARKIPTGGHFEKQNKEVCCILTFDRAVMFQLFKQEDSNMCVCSNNATKILTSKKQKV